MRTVRVAESRRLLALVARARKCDGRTVECRERWDAACLVTLGLVESGVTQVSLAEILGVSKVRVGRMVKRGKEVRDG